MHVQCENGQRFQVVFIRPDDFKHDMKILISIDGRHVYKLYHEHIFPRVVVKTFDERAADGRTKSFRLRRRGGSTLKAR